jgi:hypothetical protein
MPGMAMAKISSRTGWSVSGPDMGNSTQHHCQTGNTAKGKVVWEFEKIGSCGHHQCCQRQNGIFLAHRCRRSLKAIPHKERLATLHAICLQIFRHISQKCS